MKKEVVTHGTLLDSINYPKLMELQANTTVEKVDAKNMLSPKEKTYQKIRGPRKRERNKA
jgi:hypothetical protein